MTLREIELDQKMDELYVTIVTMGYVILVLCAGMFGWLTPKGTLLCLLSTTAIVGLVAHFFVADYRGNLRFEQRHRDNTFVPLDEFTPAHREDRRHG